MTTVTSIVSGDEPAIIHRTQLYYSHVYNGLIALIELVRADREGPVHGALITDPGMFLYMLDTDFWENLENTACRVSPSLANITHVGHPTRDRWFPVELADQGV